MGIFREVFFVRMAGVLLRRMMIHLERKLVVATEAVAQAMEVGVVGAASGQLN
jgi:hypothetical protein